MREYILGKSKQFSLEIEQILCKVGHSALKGYHAENIFREYLCEVLPKKYSVDTGIICSIDHQNNKTKYSKQMDVVIYDGFNSPPLQNLSGFKIFPSESIYAVIEVKTELSHDNLFRNKYNCLENIRSAKILPKINFVPQYGFTVSELSKTIGFVFAFRSKSLIETLAKKMKKYREEENKEDISEYPECVCVLNKGYFLTNTPLQIGERTLGDFDYSTGEDSLLAFTLLLINLLNNQILLPVDLWKYQSY